MSITFDQLLDWMAWRKWRIKCQVSDESLKAGKNKGFVFVMLIRSSPTDEEEHTDNEDRL